MSKLETNTIDTVSGTSTLQVGSTNTSTITLGVSGDTINVPSGVTIANSGTATGFGGDNTPSFKAYLASNQTIGTGSFTKALFATEAWDTDSAFASNKFTVPSGEGGKYVFTYNLLFYNLSDGTRFEARLYKNGSAVGGTTFRETGSNTSQQVDMSYSVAVTASASDYFEVYVQHTASGDQTLYGPNNGDSSFTGYKLIGV